MKRDEVVVMREEVGDVADLHAFNSGYQIDARENHCFGPPVFESNSCQSTHHNSLSTPKLSIHLRDRRPGNLNTRDGPYSRCSSPRLPVGQGTLSPHVLLTYPFSFSFSSLSIMRGFIIASYLLNTALFSMP